MPEYKGIMDIYLKNATEEQLNIIRFLMNSELYKKSRPEFHKNIYRKLNISIVPNIGTKFRFTFEPETEFIVVGDIYDGIFDIKKTGDGSRHCSSVGFHDIDLIKIP